MNKKLFSWKALAGLALLVAMGLTSCKQGTEVDPTDPYNTTKPTTPGYDTKGDATVTFTLTTPADFGTLYDKWYSSLKAEEKTALSNKGEITIALNTAAMKLDGTRLTLRNIWGAGSADKVLNVVFNGAFAETKNALPLDASNLPKHLVRFYLPSNATAYDLSVGAGDAIPQLQAAAGSALIGKLTYDRAASSQNKLAIGSGVAVTAVTAACDPVSLEGGSVAAAVKNATFSVKTKQNGGGVDAAGITVNDVIAAGSFEVKTSDAALNSLSIEKGVAATATTAAIPNTIYLDKNANITNIAGADKGLCQLWCYDAASLAKIKSISKVSINGNPASLTLGGDIFNDVAFNIPTVVSGNMVEVTFNQNVTLAPASRVKTFTFSKSNFASGVKIASNWPLGEFVYDGNGNPVYTTTYYWIQADGTWSAGSAAPEDILAIDKALDPTGAVVTNLMSADEKKAAINGHKWYSEINYVFASYSTDQWDLVLELTGCKIDGKAVNSTNAVGLLDTAGAIATTAIRYYTIVIDGVAYKLLNAGATYVLVVK